MKELTLSQTTKPLPTYDRSYDEHKHSQRKPTWLQWVLQILRFSLVGLLNTALDLLVFNGFVWLLPTRNTAMLLIYNSIAYAIGGINSFLLNKYWTFGRRQATSVGEVSRFIVTTLLGILCNDILIWLSGNFFHSLIADTRLWANITKIIAITGTVLISYMGMRLWVFMTPTQYRKKALQMNKHTQMANITNHLTTVPVEWYEEDNQPSATILYHSLSVILPAHNEEQIIEQTVTDVLAFLQSAIQDFDVIVVDDGSTDRTGDILARLASQQPRLHVITHPVNRGYGAALVSGFQAVDKELAFFMDSDGQFDIHELARFFPYVDQYDAVLGYRINRQDSWVRLLNAWGWKILVRLVLGVRVRDVDCAFKLYRSSFLWRNQLETSGAMINAEMLYKLKRDGCSFKEVGVRHLPRLSGNASGAHPNVILHAFKELFVYGLAWKREERERNRR